MFTISLFLVHTILFGYVFTNSIVAGAISDNASQMMWFLITVIVTYFYVSQNNLFSIFISTSFYVSGLQLLIAGLMHRQDFVNPVWGLYQAFTADIRYKTAFGFVHPGYLSNACFLVIVLSVYFFELNRYKTGKQRTVMWVSLIGIDLLAGSMLMAAAERSGIISTFIVISFYFVFVFLRVRLEKKTSIFFASLFSVALIVTEVTGGFTYIWSNSNRALNITKNYPVFLELGNLWTGMGYTDNSAFHSEIAVFGMDTSSLDMYYVYIFFTTGIIGCILIGSALVIMLIKLLTQRKTALNITTIGLYLAMLFFAFWQCNMVTYRYVSPTMLFLIILFSMSDDFCLGALYEDKKNDGCEIKEAI